MEKEEAAGKHNSLWTLLSSWYCFKSFPFRIFPRPFNVRALLAFFNFKKKGFTLVELVVVLAIVATLIFLLLAVIDPTKQLQKAKDGLRKHDLTQIRSALDIYYNDKGCYPATVPFGGELREGATVYMPKVPQDPDYPKNIYVYEVDASESCPQWVALFSNLATASENSLSCGLSSLPNCTPPDYQPTFSCVLLGSVDCGYISTNPVNFPPSGSVPPTASPTTSPTPTSTPTPSPTPSCSADYDCTGIPPRCNVIGGGLGKYCSSNCDGVCL